MMFVLFGQPSVIESSDEMVTNEIKDSMIEKVEKQEQRCKLKVKMNVYSVLMRLEGCKHKDCW